MQLGLPSRAYVLSNKVTHARLLPVRSKHAFTYPTVALLLSLEALERYELDLPISFGLGYFFRFGSIWGTLVGLRGNSYLTRENDAPPVSIRKKLDRVLMDRDAITAPSEIRDVWMMTMPAICAFEGINPLTVYYCYRFSGELSVIVLEVHNTFGEGHVYVLQLGKDEDMLPPNEYYDHQWTFPRRFFVSPFNDRSGFYTVAIKLPSHSPFEHSACDPPKPSIRIHLHLPDHDSAKPTAGPLKLIAHLTPQSTVPLSVPNLLATLSRFPFALLITLLRILYEAWLLHYHKHLPVFARPEPFPALPRECDTQESPLLQVTARTASMRDYPGGVIYQNPTFLEQLARWRTLAFLEQRCAETGIDIILLSGNPSMRTSSCSAQRNASEVSKPPSLTVFYTSPRLFTLFLLAPCAHFFHAGCNSKVDGQCPLFSVSDEDAFMRIFDQVCDEEQGWIERTTQWIRLLLVSRDATLDCDQCCHPLTTFLSSSTGMVDLLLVSVLVAQDWVMRKVFRLLRVQFVPGTEPWAKDIWRRARLGRTTE